MADDQAITGFGIGNGSVYFDTSAIRKDSNASLEARIAQCNAIIDTLMETVMQAALTGNITEYTLNDGMTTIKGIYRDPVSVEAAILRMERLRNIYLRRLNGTNQIRLIDKKSFVGWNVR